MGEQSLSKVLLNQLAIPKKLLSNYAQIGLDEVEVMILLQIHRYLDAGIHFPTPKEISSHLTLSEEACSIKLRDLFQRNFLEIKEINEEEGKIGEAYSLEPLWQRLCVQKEEKNEHEEGQLFILFERELARPLSPIEIETINSWLDDDHISPTFIIAALREAVLMGKLNLNYIDRILREWKRKGLKTVEEAKRSSEQFRKGQAVKTYETKERDDSIYFNWLDGG